ncbi:MAG TPA: SDR family oxidoreductase [Dehalococcoidia bacterium]|nr:SDR family oxidoreductase [Dehalococcoidia bacterium]
MSDRFRDQAVLVTGGGRGIGRATALEFASEGANVVLCGRRMDALEESAAEARRWGVEAEVVRCDVAVDEDLVHLVDATMTRFGRIDVLVNNAGVVAGGRLDEIGVDDVGRMVGVNVWAPIRLAQLVTPHMRAAKSGAIVNLSSLAGRMGMPYYATYCASKFAMRGFSEALRRELAPDGVHVMAVFPGGTATDMTESVEFDRFGMSAATADQVARAIVRGVRWRQAEVFIGFGESLMSHWNDLAPWSVDVGVEMMRDRVREAVRGQRTT